MNVSEFFISVVGLLNRCFILFFTNVLSLYPVKVAFCILVGIGLFGIVFKFLKG